MWWRKTPRDPYYLEQLNQGNPGWLLGHLLAFLLTHERRTGIGFRLSWVTDVLKSAALHFGAVGVVLPSLRDDLVDGLGAANWLADILAYFLLYGLFLIVAHVLLHGYRLAHTEQVDLAILPFLVHSFHLTILLRLGLGDLLAFLSAFVLADLHLLRLGVFHILSLSAAYRVFVATRLLLLKAYVSTRLA